MTVTLTIPGKPYAKKRPRFSKETGRAYDPAENAKAEDTLGNIALPHFPRPFLGAVKVTILCKFAMAQSWPKRKILEHRHRPHLSRPDLDNLGKWVLDGLNRIAFADDKQVAEIGIRKIWADRDETIVWIEELPL